MWNILIVSFVGLSLCLFVLVTEWLYRPGRAETWKIRDVPRSAVVIIVGVLVCFLFLDCLVYFLAIR